ncbi:serum/glucocorticoid-regulated kinase 1, partial [Clonorchis sinensis]
MSFNSITLLSLTDQTNHIDGKKCTLFALRFQSDAKEWCMVKQLGDFNLLLNAGLCQEIFGIGSTVSSWSAPGRLNCIDYTLYLQDSSSRYGDNGSQTVCPCFVYPELCDLICRAIPEDFVLVKKIGMGAFGQVYLANSRTTNGVFAIKVLKKKQQIERPSGVQQVMSERNVLIKSLQHPFLCKLRYTFQSASMLFFVMDYVNGGELYSYIQRERFTEERAKFYVAEIACALGYLHSEKIIYRDLKPENILLDGQGHIVLTDFGLCTNADGVQETGTVCGTPEYLAPESIRAGEYSYAVDWWGLGTVFYEMLYGLPPFFDTNRRKMHEAVLMKPVKLGDNISEEAKQLLLG